MRHSIIVISIVVGMIAAALVAVDSIGVVADVPERTVAARGRGVKGINAQPTRSQRNKPARESREDVRVAGLYAGVGQAFRISKSAIEEAMYAVGVAIPPRKDRFAVVAMDLPDGNRWALVYHVDNPSWRKLKRVLLGGEYDPNIVAYGREQGAYDLPVEVGSEYIGGFVNPSFVIVEESDRKGRVNRAQNVVVDGRRVEVRARVQRVAKKGYCFNCRESVRRDEIRDVTFSNGRDATVGGCVNCGASVYRTGTVGTEVVPVVALQGAAAKVAVPAGS